MYSVVMKALELVYLTMIPLDDYAPVHDTLASGILVQALTIGIVAFVMFVL